MNEIERLLDDLRYLAGIHRGFRVRIDRIGEEENTYRVWYFTPHIIREHLTHGGIIPEVLHEQAKENNDGVRELQEMADRAVRIIRAAGIAMTDQPTPLDTLAYWAIGENLHGRHVARSLGNGFLEIRNKLLDELAKLPAEATQTHAEPQWVAVDNAHAKQSLKTWSVDAHHERSDQTGIRRVARGRYEVRTDRLRHYIDDKHWGKYK